MSQNRRSSGAGMVSVLLVTAAAIGAAYCIKTVQDQQTQERYEAYQREHQADLAANYDLVTAAVLQKDINEYDTGDWEYDDEGDTHWQTYHITEYTYTVEYEHNGEKIEKTFTNRENYPEVGQTMEIYVDKEYGRFSGDAEYVKR